MFCLRRIAIIGFLGIVASACVTRNKHKATVADWQGRLNECTAEVTRLDTEGRSKLAERDKKLTGLEGELSATKTAAEKRRAELTGKLKASQEEIEALR